MALVQTITLISQFSHHNPANPLYNEVGIAIHGDHSNVHLQFLVMWNTMCYIIQTWRGNKGPFMFFTPANWMNTWATCFTPMEETLSQLFSTDVNTLIVI